VVTEKTSIIPSEVTIKQSSIITSETTTETKAITSDSTIEMITSTDSDSSQMMDDEDDQINLIWILLFFIIIGILCLVITLLMYLVFRRSKFKFQFLLIQKFV